MIRLFARIQLSVLATTAFVTMSLATTPEWREGTAEPLRSRFARLRGRAAHRDEWRVEPRVEEWLLIEWPKGRERADQILAFDASAKHCLR